MSRLIKHYGNCANHHYGTPSKITDGHSNSPMNEFDTDRVRP